jgi:outer membrane immunogenic protein
MKRLLLASVAGVALMVGAPADAADLGVRPTYKAPPPVAAPVPVFSWTGFYIGANVGYSWGKWAASSNQRLFAFESFSNEPDVDGWLGGLQAGYNFQSGQWVLGLEGDIQITGEKRTHSWTDPGTNCNQDQDLIPPQCNAGPAFVSHEWRLPWFGTLRGRAGVLAAPTWLLYVTGGLAFGESKYDFAFSQPGAGLFQAFSNSVTKAGWTVGGGLEAAIGYGWTAKLEYLFIDLGTQSINTVDLDGNPLNIEHKIRDNIVRVGLNYRFGLGKGKGPVVASY